MSFKLKWRSKTLQNIENKIFKTNRKIKKTLILFPPAPSPPRWGGRAGGSCPGEGRAGGRARDLAQAPGPGSWLRLPPKDKLKINFIKLINIIIFVLVLLISF